MIENDWFEKFESKVSQFAGNHKFSILLVSGILIGIFIIALLLSLICIPTTFAFVEQNQTERYNAHYPPTHEDYVSEETIKNWNEIVVPAAMFLIGYLSNSTIIIGVSYITIVMYFMIRWIYRSRRDMSEVEKNE
jgi:succinate dehydrogenase hydrophobic anchor subunit